MVPQILKNKEVKKTELVSIRFEENFFNDNDL